MEAVWYDKEICHLIYTVGGRLALGTGHPLLATAEEITVRMGIRMDLEIIRD